MTTQQIKPDDRSWEKVIRKYNHPDMLKSIWQIFNSVIPYMVICVAMYFSLQYSYWITLLLAIPASGFLIRIFIIFHDCGHGSFFKSLKTSKLIGMLCGILTTTPYKKWHYSHAIHHATAANLDKRGIGDVWTLTKDEYLNSSRKRQIFYKLARYPLVLMLIGPIYQVLFQNRFTNNRLNKEDRNNVYITNILLAMLITGIGLLIGFKAFILIQVPILFIAHSAGIWLFYIQHNFEDVSWDRTNDWSYMEAALKGSSFLQLPSFFQWFTGNIGFHHIHHLSPRIPNYNLARCHYENEIFSGVRPIRFMQTFKFLNLNLWDEENQRMIKFSEARPGILATSRS